jgi:acyl-CoA reductase-like NAD-dependent aldehyde dehydrogenase
MSGNATLYKPSEYTPLTGLVEDILQRAGFASDWVQVIYGTGEVGKQLIDQRPDKIFFTGSVETGKKVMTQAAQQIIPVELELGGKDPAIVFEDANVQRAAAGVLFGGMTTAGQSCTSVERAYIQQSIFNEFKKEIVRLANSMVQNVDQDGGADMGQMTTEMQVKIVSEQIADAKAKGATLLTGSNWDGQSSQIPPIILENVTSEMKVATEETFGPVIPLFSFNTEEEVIQLANDSQYGLSASVWSADKKRAIRVSRALEVGNVSINNVMLTEGNAYLPFGGRKLSGIGSYKGIEGIRGFAQQKSILVDGNSSKIEPNWYPYTSKKYQLFSSFIQKAFGGGLLNFVKFVIAGLTLESYSDKVGKKGRG